MGAKKGIIVFGSEGAVVWWGVFCLDKLCVCGNVVRRG